MRFSWLALMWGCVALWLQIKCNTGGNHRTSPNLPLRVEPLAISGRDRQPSQCHVAFRTLPCVASFEFCSESSLWSGHGVSRRWCVDGLGNFLGICVCGVSIASSKNCAATWSISKFCLALSTVSAVAARLDAGMWGIVRIRLGIAACPDTGARSVFPLVLGSIDPLSDTDTWSL